MNSHAESCIVLKEILFLLLLRYLFFLFLTRPYVVIWRLKIVWHYFLVFCGLYVFFVDKVLLSVTVSHHSALHRGVIRFHWNLLWLPQLSVEIAFFIHLIRFYGHYNLILVEGPFLHLNKRPSKVYITWSHLWEFEECLCELFFEYADEICDLDYEYLGGNDCNDRVLDWLFKNRSIISEAISARQLINFKKFRLYLMCFIVFKDWLLDKEVNITGFLSSLRDFEFNFSKELDTSWFYEENARREVFLPQDQGVRWKLLIFTFTCNFFKLWSQAVVEER